MAAVVVVTLHILGGVIGGGAAFGVAVSDVCVAAHIPGGGIVDGGGSVALGGEGGVRGGCSALAAALINGSLLILSPASSHISLP